MPKATSPFVLGTPVIVTSEREVPTAFVTYVRRAFVSNYKSSGAPRHRHFFRPCASFISTEEGRVLQIVPFSGKEKLGFRRKKMQKFEFSFDTFDFL